MPFSISGTTGIVSTPVLNADSIVTNDIDVANNITGNVTAEAITTQVLNKPYVSGEVVKMLVLPYTEINQLATNTHNTTTDKVIATYDYTPKTNNTFIFIEYYTMYSVSGSGPDAFVSRIKIDNVNIGYARQVWGSTAGGTGTRSGVLFPIAGRYTNTTGVTPKQITITVARDGSDDTISVFGNDSSWLKITEIAI